jgi:hypothetical protein
MSYPLAAKGLGARLRTVFADLKMGKDYCDFTRQPLARGSTSS